MKSLQVALSVVLLADVLHLYSHLDLFIATALWPWFPLRPLLIVWIVVLAVLLTGWRSKLVLAVNWACAGIVLGLVAPNDGFQQAACDSVMIGTSALLLVLSYVRPEWHKWLIAAYLSSIYMDSGIHKAISTMWSSGNGVLTPMTLPSLVWMNTAWIAAVPISLWRCAGYAVVLFELLFPLLYLWRRPRIFALACGVVLHLGIGIIYPIPAFAAVMLCLYVPLVISEWRLPTKCFPQWTPRAAAFAGMWLLLVAASYAPVRPIRKPIYMATGITSHAVFEDDAFLRYDYPLRLVTPRGPIPYSHAGLFPLDIRDRVWELWWKRTQAPQLSIATVEARIAGWTHDAIIEGRPQISSIDHPRAESFTANFDAPWHAVGAIQHGSVSWPSPPANRQEQFGDYMDRILQR